MKKTIFIRTKVLIKKCYNINSSIPKGYGTRSSTYKKYYNKKEKLLIQILSNIKKYALNIKYGMNDGIMYFAVDGEQFSFHSPFIIIGKKYKGEWQGTKRIREMRKPNGQKYGRKDCF